MSPGRPFPSGPFRRPRRSIGALTPAAPAAPDTPSTPSPADTATAYYSLLSWVSVRATKFDIYLDTVTPPVARAVIGYYVGTSYIPTLAPSTTYYWKIVAYNDGGSAAGPVWSFTTLSATAVIVEVDGSIVTPHAKTGSLSIHDVLGASPNTGALLVDVIAPTGAEAIKIGLSTLDDADLLFAGEIQAVDETYVGNPATTQRWPLTLIDHTFRINKRRPFGGWTNVSATTIARAIVAQYASGFTSVHVQDGLPVVSINFDGSQDFMTCMRALATAISDDTNVGKTKVDYGRDVHLYLTESETAPSPVNAAHPPLHVPSPITFSVDHSQIRTRVYGKGYGSTVSTDLAAGTVRVPIANPAFFNPSGGTVIASTVAGGAQFLALTYESVGVGVTITPSTAWNAQTAAEARDWRAVAWSPSLGLFAAVSFDGLAAHQVMTSPDGIAWTLRTAPTSEQWLDIVWADSLGLFVASTFGVTTYGFMTSPDGITWTGRNAPGGVTRMWNLAWSHSLGLLVATVNGTANVATSPDGITWTSRSASAVKNWNGVTWASALGLFVAVADDGVAAGSVMTSPDGSTWTAGTASVASSWFSVAWSPALALLVAVSTAGAVMTSPDSITWTTRATSLGVLSKVIWSAEQAIFLAAGSGGVLTSTDGISWTRPTTPGAGTWYGAVWAESVSTFVIVGDNSASLQVLTNISTRTPYSQLVGINHWNGIPVAIASGSALNIWLQRDDLAAQAALGLLELDAAGNPTDGIREYTIVDERRGQTSLTALCDADLAIFSRPIVTARYYTRDPETKSGRTVPIDLGAFGEVGDFTIQSVDITVDGPALYPLRQVVATSAAFTLSDLIRRVVLTA